MRPEEHQRAVDHLRALMNDEHFKNMHRAIHAALESQNFLSMEDQFPFEERCCQTVCLGDCCVGTKYIHLSPIDVDWIIQSPNVRLKREELVQKTMEIYIGNESLVPQAVLKTWKSGRSWICPFFLLQGRTNELGEPVEGGHCGLGHAYKPKVCLLFPLGYYAYPYQQTICDFFTVTPCYATNTDQRRSVREHIGSYFERRAWTDGFNAKMLELVAKLRAQFSEATVITAMNATARIAFNEGFNLDNTDTYLNDLIAFLKQKQFT